MEVLRKEVKESNFEQLFLFIMEQIKLISDKKDSNIKNLDSIQ